MKKLSVISIILLLITGNGFANIKLPAIFSDNMVLQQEMDVPVWGWSDPGEQITVSLAGQYAKTVAGTDGRWELFLKPLKAGGPYDLILKGKNMLTLKNVLIGEVWVCSGQSNMEMPVGNVAKWYSGVLNYEEEIAAADFPQIHLFKAGRTVADKPKDDSEGSWSTCNPETIIDFSATAYFFGRKLHKDLGVPIGLIDASCGGTNISAWMSKEVLESDDDFIPILNNFQQRLDNYPSALEVYKKRIAKHQKDVAEAKASGKPVTWREPMPPSGGPGDRNTPSGLYNGMISPLMNIRIAGVIWYQGENNTGNPTLYEKLFPTMIKNWRNEWRQNDFPFYYVQLAGFNTNQTWWGGAGINWVLLREAQLKTLTVENTGMAVAADIGDANDTHAKNKQEVGKRLALLALADTYGKDIIFSGPLYKSKEIYKDQIVLHFEHIGSGLRPREGEGLKGFAVSGANKIFFEAHALIQGDSILLSSAEVTKPVAVRYGWKDYPECNLYNEENLPASPFRTDDWSEE